MDTSVSFHIGYTAEFFYVPNLNLFSLSFFSLMNHSMYSNHHHHLLKLFVRVAGSSSLIVILAILRSSPGPGVDGCLENFGDGGGFGVALEEGLLRRPRRRRWPAFGREGAPAAGLLVALLLIGSLRFIRDNIAQDIHEESCPLVGKVLHVEAK